MFFRNLTLFRFQADTAADLARLADVLPEHSLRPCGPLEMATRGFVPPVGRGDDAALVQPMQSCTLFTAGGEDKLLPPAVINDELRHKVEKIADEEGRKVGGRERKRIREDLLTEFLPRAFVRSSRLSAYVDTAHHWLVIDTASRKPAEQLLTMTREALGSFPVLPMAPEESPRVLMTDWLSRGTLPDGLALGDECELRDPATSTGAIALCRRQDMDAEEIKEHLRNGKQVFKLGLVFDDRLSFVLGEDLVVRKLRFLDVVMDELGDSEDAQTEFTASFALMALELQRLLAKFAEWFGLQTDAPLHLHKQEAPRTCGRRHEVRDLTAASADRLPAGSVRNGQPKCSDRLLRRFDAAGKHRHSGVSGEGARQRDVLPHPQNLRSIGHVQTRVDMNRITHPTCGVKPRPAVSLAHHSSTEGTTNDTALRGNKDP